MLNHLIDLHAHVLPQLDDGARTINQSIAIGRAAWADGISTIVMTPHYYEDKSKGMLSRRLEAMSLLRSAFSAANLPIEILPGFEVNATLTLLNRRSMGALTLAGTKWLLLERPYIYGDEFEKVADAVFDQGLFPLIAHPERYAYFTDDFATLQALVSRGAWAQVTSVAVAGQQGPDVQKWCLRAFELDLAHVVASDVHNLTYRPPQMQAAAQVLRSEFGEDHMREIMIYNPAKLLGRRL